MSETATSLKQCELCLNSFEPGRPEQRICDFCLGVSTRDHEVSNYTPAPPRNEDDPGFWDDATCKGCGKAFIPWRNGRFYVRSICKPCLTTKRTATVKAVWGAKGGKKPGGRKPKPKVVPDQTGLKREEYLVTPSTKLNYDHLLINFRRHPDLFAAIREVADMNFRTPEFQVLWMIKMLCTEGTR
jgi:hypothetical protein